MPSTTTTKPNAFSSLSMRSIYLIGLLGVLGLLTVMLFAPFINIIVIAFILVEMFYPVYLFLKRKLNSSGFAAILATVVSFLVVIIPLSIFVLITAGEAVSFTRQAQDYLVNNNSSIIELPQRFVDNANELLTNLNVPAQFRIKPVDLSSSVEEIGSGLATAVGTIAAQLLTGGLEFLFQIFLLIVSMIYLFQLRGELRAKLSYFSPLDNDLDRLFFDKFITTTRAVLKGSVVVAVLQATAVIVVMIMMGFSSPVLLWLIMVFVSLIPVGSGIVWAPAGIIMIISGQPIQGIFLIIYSAVIINVIDTVVRPYMMKGATQLHPLVTLFSVLGGISMFGLIGVLYGPLITVFFISLMHVYNAQRGVSLSYDE
jgi:predicted PurR-regulated permease PerM